MNIPTISDQTPRNTTKKPVSKRKRIILFGSILVVVSLLVGGSMFIAKKASQPDTVSETKQLAKAPAMVGKYRYVNACQVVPLASYKQVFGYDISNSVAIYNDYADGSRTKRYNTTSGCATSFGDQTLDIGGGNTAPGDAGSIRITLTQYTDPKLAAIDVNAYKGLKGQEVDLSAIGIDDSITTSAYEPVQVGDITAYYNTTKGERFYFAYRNISASFVVSNFNGTDDKLHVITNDYVRQLIPKIVPVVKASIDNTRLPQEPLAIKSVGKPLLGGKTAKSFQMCDLFTSDDFKTFTGSLDDSTQVNAQYDMNPILEAERPDSDPRNSGGLGDASCKRKGYIDTVQPSVQSYPDIKDFAPADAKYKKIEYPVVTEAIRYFKNNADAINGAKTLQNNHKTSYPDTVNTEVSGLGDYAAFSKYTFSSEIVDTGSVDEGDKMDYLYVVKGPYLVSIDMFYSSGETNIVRRGSDAQYKQAAQLLIDRLPN